MKNSDSLVTFLILKWNEMSDANKYIFHLKVASREGTIYEGQVRSISSFNEKGEFDVLASHANFISLVKKRLTIRETENEDSKKDIAFDNALIRVRENLVEV